MGEAKGLPIQRGEYAVNIYVGNLPFNANDADLRALFADYGDITSASVITDRDTGRSRGFGFVELADAALAGKAIDTLDGHDWDGRRLTVNEAKPRRAR
jgi:RNA recognition motif-containing protein